MKAFYIFFFVFVAVAAAEDVAPPAPPPPTHLENPAAASKDIPPSTSLDVGAPENEIYVQENMRGVKMPPSSVKLSELKTALQKTPYAMQCKLKDVKTVKASTKRSIKDEMLQFTVPGVRNRKFLAVQVVESPIKWDFGAGVSLYKMKALDKTEVWVKVDLNQDGKPQINRVYIQPNGKPGFDC